MKLTSAAALASVVASMFATGCGAPSTNPGTTQQTVKCAGVNSCAGQGACGGTLPDGGMNNCAGHNACAGQGWIEVPSAEDCTTKGGTVLQ